MNYDNVPRVGDYEIDLEFLSSLMQEDGELVLQHRPKRFRADGVDVSEARFVTCIAMVDAPEKAVKDQVTNFEDYSALFKFINRSSLEQSTDKVTKVEFESVFETPVITPQFEYKLHYEETETGDIVFHSPEGDFAQIFGRWEFHSLGEEQTLLVYTSWFEFGKVGWTLSTMFWAQPDLKVNIPVVQGALTIDLMKKTIETNPPEDSSEPENLPAEPDTPLLTQRHESLSGVEPLVEHGTLMLVHPKQWINDSGDPLDMTFVTAMGLLEMNLDDAREFSTDFERYTDYIPQVGSVETNRDENGHLLADWFLDLGIKVVSIGLSYTLKYQQETENALSFKAIEGDVEHVYGAIEWEALDPRKTLLFYTTATQIGQDDSFIAKLVNLFPHKQLVIGVTVVGVAVEKMVEWTRNQKG